MASEFSIFDLFRFGIGPSSSHTTGPMRAAGAFVAHLRQAGLAPAAARIQVELFGSLALTGRGHSTDRAALLGLMGEEPASYDAVRAEAKLRALRETGLLNLGDGCAVPFSIERDLLFTTEFQRWHANTLRFRAFAEDGAVMAEKTYCSVGGGAICEAGQPLSESESAPCETPYPYDSAAELVDTGERNGLSIWRMVEGNEAARHGLEETHRRLDAIWAAMQDCVARGIAAEGILPGGLHVRRRASQLHARLPETSAATGLAVIDWVNVFALAVNEENAAGGKVVTAPTNGSAGVVPAVLHYYHHFVPGANTGGIHRFLLTSGGIGLLYKANASISGAEVGCQGEIGVACSMAAAGLVAALGGSNRQIEHAAEIGMEHHLGLTCDPVAGLVQAPCIERNAMAAVKALNAARLSMAGGSEHHIVSLDQVIHTMLETGRDMQSRYKETALGGLAVNVVAC